MRFPLLQGIDYQCEMPPAVMRVNRLISIANQVKFLVFTEPKPSTRKVKRGSIHHRKPHRIPVKSDTCVDIGDMEGNVIQLSGKHRNVALCARKPVGPLAPREVVIRSFRRRYNNRRHDREPSNARNPNRSTTKHARLRWIEAGVVAIDS